MKVLISILIGLVVVGCGKKQSTNTKEGNNTPAIPAKQNAENKTPSKASLASFLPGKKIVVMAPNWPRQGMFVFEESGNCFMAVQTLNRSWKRASKGDGAYEIDGLEVELPDGTFMVFPSIQPKAGDTISLKAPADSDLEDPTPENPNPKPRSPEGRIVATFTIDKIIAADVNVKFIELESTELLEDLELIEENVRITIQAKYDSDPATKGAIIETVELKKSGGNKYTGSIGIISPDGSRRWPDLEVTVDEGKFKWTVKPPKKNQHVLPKLTPEMVIASLEKAVEKIANRPAVAAELKSDANWCKEDQAYAARFAKETNKKMAREKIGLDATSDDALADWLIINETQTLAIKSSSSANNIVRAITEFADENDNNYPPVDKWGDSGDIKGDIGSTKVIYSPQLVGTGWYPPGADKVKPEEAWQLACHYAMNASLAGKKRDVRRQQVLLFECDLGWNGSGGLDDAIKYMDKNNLVKIPVALEDGATKLMTQEELKTLKW